MTGSSVAMITFRYRQTHERLVVAAVAGWDALTVGRVARPLPA